MPTRILLTAEFDKFARKAKISDAALVDAIKRAEVGLVDADLGGGVVKLRIARPGQGRSGGFRTIVALMVGSSAFFLYGFAKNDMDNIGPVALEDYKDIAQVFQALPDDQLTAAIEAEIFREIER